MQQAIESKISDAEWEVMRVIWTNQPVTSRFISNVLMEKMSWKAATIKTLIGRLVDKGVVSTEQEGNKYLYSAIQTEEESIQSMTSAVLNHICSTKVGHVLANLVEDSQLSQADLDKLATIIQEKRQTAPSSVACNCIPGQCHC